MATVVPAPAGTGDIARNFALLGGQLSDVLQIRRQRQQRQQQLQQQQQQQRALQLFGQQQGFQIPQNLPPQFLANFLLQQQQQRGALALQAAKPPSLQIKDSGESKILFNPVTGAITPTGFPSTRLPATTINVTPEVAQKSAQEEIVITNKFQEEADKENIRNPDSPTIAVVKTDIKTGQRRIVKEPKPRVQGEQLTKLIALKNIKDLLNNVDIGFDKDFVGLADQFLGRVGEVIGTASAQEVSFRRNVLDIQDTILRNRSGAQINEVEAARLIRIAPDLGLADKTFLPRLTSLRTNMESRIANTIQTLMAAGYNAQELKKFIAGNITIQQLTRPSARPTQLLTPKKQSQQQRTGLTPAQPQIPQTIPFRQTATNPETGKRIESFDGGKTWQPIR